MTDHVARVIPPAGVSPRRVTAPGADAQLLYFTSSSVLSGHELVVLTDRTGHPNLLYVNTATGEERLLTDNREGMLKSYVYFTGNPYRGLGKASVSLHAASRTAYYIQGLTLCAVTPDSPPRIIAQLPRGQMTAFTHVSACGTRVCVPTTDAAALDGDTQLSGPPAYSIDGRVQKENLSSTLHVFDTRTGQLLLAERVPRCWITHVQFSPVDPAQILYNHEWPADCSIRRMWLYDGRSHIRLRPAAPEGVVPAESVEWICHEMWERDGSAIIYHGKIRDGGIPLIGRVHPDGTHHVELNLPAPWREYGHFTVGNPGRLVTDGYFHAADDPPANCGRWISVLDVDWAGRKITYRPLCRHGSSWAYQDEHPHPIFTPDDAAVFFTSDREGQRAVYRVDHVPTVP